ncbi:Gfo/Idh/MocA family protein [Alkalihalobacillus trypoxylicola]|uniref:Virulence factor MviM n=1 Tax=Alkalihalobacillus trypoxylicola TaxID=519424 RepID=A0A161PLF5_9BACI|nr:Gfo/Idh/MocA family oxidoreductase [Alkalihalobacillus trypoxylicola]KYG34437.1 virulence factor MviM [Alkalihalobacillus trypoxylicola]
MKPRIGMVGLGSIAQKAYLPILTKEIDWTFVGAYSPNKQKREKICHQYRIQAFEDLSTLSQSCDAIFVHSSTGTHFEIVSQLLQNGIDIYVDKPLAASIEEAEKLVQLSESLGRKLMVGFNRRFSPMYVQLKQLLKEKDTAWINVDKHRIARQDSLTFEHILLDDYLHLVDTIRWLADGHLRFDHGFLKKTTDSKLIFSKQQFLSDQNNIYHTSMHRSAGTNLEQIELVTDGGIYRVKNMNIFEVEKDNQITTTYSGPWQTILEQKGFENAVAHFIKCLQQNTMPSVSAREGLESQKLLQKLISDSKHF